MLVSLLLMGCAPHETADCVAASKDGKTLMCCPVGYQTSTMAPQWRCAWVHKLVEG